MPIPAVSTGPELAGSLEATDDERLAQAEALVRAFCGWHIAPSREATVTLYPDGSGTLLLPTLKLTSVTSVTEDGVAPLLTTDYRVYEHGEILRVPPWCWASSTAGVTVVFTHGYDPAPADVTAVVQAVGKRLHGNPSGLQSKGTGPFTETYSTDLLPLERAALMKYRLPART